jgi:hypothetical protein
MPLLWENDVIGWANVNVRDGKLTTDIGFAKRQPHGTAFRRAMEEECERLNSFLGLQATFPADL